MIELILFLYGRFGAAGEGETRQEETMSCN